MSVQILATIFMPGATFHCAFCRNRKQRMSKSIQEVTKALITIIFTIIFPYTICSVELLIWQYCEDGERTVLPDSGLLGVCCVFANAKLQLLEGRLHLANVAFAEEKCIFFVCVCCCCFFNFIEKQRNLGFGQPLNIVFVSSDYFPLLRYATIWNMGLQTSLFK